MLPKRMESLTTVSDIWWEYFEHISAAGDAQKEHKNEDDDGCDQRRGASKTRIEGGL